MVNVAGWRGSIRQLSPDISERVAPVSQSIWCDVNDPKTNAFGQIGHSFSEKDPDRQHFTNSRNVNVPTGNSFGQPTYQERREITEVFDMCGYHWRRQNPFSQDAPEAIQPTLADLEKEKTAYEEGFDAGQNHALYSAQHAKDPDENLSVVRIS